MRKRGGDETAILSARSAEQQTQLASLLEILQSTWLKGHAQRHKG